MVVFLEGLLWLLRFAVGASIFSFLHVVACRLPIGESVVRGRSHCPGCGRTLSAAELIPCISYVVQGGKCRGCGGRIPVRYLGMELAGGVAFVWCCWFFDQGKGGCGLASGGEVICIEGLWGFLYLGILAVVALIDWDTRIIYDRFHIGIALLGIAAVWLFPEHGLVDRLIGLAVVSVPMFVLALAVEGAFGGGDIKLMAVSGFLLGWRAVLFAAFVGLAAGGVYCIVMLAAGRISRKEQIAFGPFLAVGLAAALFWGDAAAGWYLSLL